MWLSPAGKKEETKEWGDFENRKMPACRGPLSGINALIEYQARARGGPGLIRLNRRACGAQKFESPRNNRERDRERGAGDAHLINTIIRRNASDRAAARLRAVTLYVSCK